MHVCVVSCICDVILTKSFNLNYLASVIIEYIVSKTK